MPEASWLLFVVASLVLITTRGQGMIRIVCHWSVVKVVSQLRWCSPRRSRTQPDLRYSGQMR
jgi:hypothetical protein